ncbi:MAG: hypothetical protein P9M08_04295 [Candidatus Erginobacter occultus]|nr:hypothetical protein [Candidatus Erginobacter occultus]
MIPESYVREWYDRAPWGTWSMVEQDLILSRMLVEIFNDPLLSESLIFRGGTALHKLFFDKYSEAGGQSITRKVHRNNLL